MKPLFTLACLLAGPFWLVGCAATNEVAPDSVGSQPKPAAATATPLSSSFEGETQNGARWIPVGAAGWAQTSVNTVVFRNSLATRGDTQFVGFYDGDGRLVLGKRLLSSSKWESQVTQYKGNVKDAHNSISIGVDGRGVLHVSWDMHGNKLRYARGKAPGSLQLGAEEAMTGDRENSVTYPQFFALPGGNLLFAYREGSSGDGDMMLNRFNVQTGKWAAVAHPLIEGEGKRNAYTNPLAIDSKGGIHLSWVWRESPDVASNHDICYAFSPDGGQSWQKSTGEKYVLPITAKTAEIAWPVPQNSELINQTSMTTDAQNRPLIATYWRDQFSQVPQYRLVWHDGQKWQQSEVGKRTMPFTLSGGGTKRIPISRPQVVAGKKGEVVVVFRDAERAAEVSAAVSRDAERKKWQVVDLLQNPIRGKVGVGTWETQAEFKDIKVTKGAQTLFASDFSKPIENWKTTGNAWEIADGVLRQSSSAANMRALVGDTSWSDYTLSLKARKTGGKEGFLIIFGSPGDDTKSWWNLGGWGNTKHALEMPGADSQQVPGKIETGRWYDVKIELQGAKVRCFLDGKLIQSGARTGAWEPSYDPEVWQRSNRLNLFWQNVGQGDAESSVNLPPQPAGVLEWTP
jgi:hypothetical protein